MAKRILILTLPLFVLLIAPGCAPKTKFLKTEMDRLFEKGFVGLDIPEINRIKGEGKNKDYPHTTLDEVWNSVIVVLMQEGFIARLSKDSGIIAVIPPRQNRIERKGRIVNYYTTGGPPLFEPLVILVKKQDHSIRVYLKCIENLNRNVDNPHEKIGFTADEGKIAEIFFGTLTTQIYSSQKWQYLYKGSGN